MSETKGAVWAVAVDEAGKGYVRARRCTACDAVMLEPTLACTSCGRRGADKEFKVSVNGKLHAFSIVHRSYPGVAVPFISAIVDLDDGTVLKGNLRGVEPRPDAIKFGMPVRLVVDDAGRTDAKGGRYLSYFFEAAQG